MQLARQPAGGVDDHGIVAAEVRAHGADHLGVRGFLGVGRRERSAGRLEPDRLLPASPLGHRRGPAFQPSSASESRFRPTLASQTSGSALCLAVS